MTILNEIEEDKEFFDFYKLFPPGIKKGREILDQFINFTKLIVSFALENREKPKRNIKMLENVFNNSSYDQIIVSLIRGLAWKGISYFLTNKNACPSLTEKIEIFNKEIEETRIYGTEAGQIIVNILATYLNIRVDVFYIEVKQKNKDFPELLIDSHCGDIEQVVRKRRSILKKSADKLFEIALYFRPG